MSATNGFHIIAARSVPRSSAELAEIPAPEEEIVNEIAKVADAMSRAMTVKQVAEALGVADRTVRRHASTLFPEFVEDGKTTYLDEAQVTAIKQAIEKSGRNDLDNVVQVANFTTELEIARMTAKVLDYWEGKARELATQVEIAKPKVEAFDRFLDASGSLCIMDVAKQLGRAPLKFFDELATRGMIFKRGGDWLPTQCFLAKEYFEVKTRTYGDPPNEHITKQTRVTAKGLDALAAIFPRQEVLA
jgi:phage antirepressor YoqD-like protein